MLFSSLFVYCNTNHVTCMKIPEGCAFIFDTFIIIKSQILCYKLLKYSFLPDRYKNFNEKFLLMFNGENIEELEQHNCCIDDKSYI